MSRKKPSNRRQSWTQKVKIGGHTYYVGFGEDEERLVEVFIDASKFGTFARGVLEAFGRMTSLALQSGMSVEDAVYAMKGCTFPPDGEVVGSPNVRHCSSIVDYIGQEIEAVYLASMVGGEIPSRAPAP